MYTLDISYSACRSRYDNLRGIGGQVQFLQPQNERVRHGKRDNRGSNMQLKNLLNKLLRKKEPDIDKLIAAHAVSRVKKQAALEAQRVSRRNRF